jgi:hypothetical protein
MDPKPLMEASRGLVTSGSGQLVFDPTLGNAFKLSAMHTSLYDKLAEGGLVMIPLLGLGLASLDAGTRSSGCNSPASGSPVRSDLQTVFNHIEKNQKPDQALNHARSIPGMAGELLSTAVQHVDEKKEYIEEILYEKMLGARARDWSAGCRSSR